MTAYMGLILPLSAPCGAAYKKADFSKGCRKSGYGLGQRVERDWREAVALEASFVDFSGRCQLCPHDRARLKGAIDAGQSARPGLHL